MPRVLRVIGSLLGLAVVLGCVLLAADAVEVRYQLPPVDGVAQHRTATHEPALVATVVAAVMVLGPLLLLVGVQLGRDRRLLWLLAGSAVAGAVLAAVLARSIAPGVF